MQRARQEALPQQDYEEPHEEEYQPSPVHPLHRYAAQHAAAPAPEPEAEYRDDLPFPEAGHEPDPSRYDDALYGRIESGEQDFQRDPAYPDDPYAYQGAYEEEEPPPRKRSSGLMTVVAVLALAVVGTGAAFAYRTYIGSPRSGGEPPIIKADNSPTKVVPAPSDAVSKTPDRMTTGGDATEKLVSREETPVDVNARSGPRIVYPPLNQNGNPPSVASVAPSAPLPPMAANGTMPNNEPRKIRTLSVKGDPAAAGLPATAPPPPANRQHGQPPRLAAARRRAAILSPMPAPTRRLALTPGARPTRPCSRPGSLPPIRRRPPAAAEDTWSRSPRRRPRPTRRPPTGRCRASSRVCSVPASSVMKRVDLGDKGVYYRAMVGPFGSPDEASQVLRQPESCRRTSASSKGINGGFLDPWVVCGLIGRMSSRAFITGVSDWN